MLSRDTDSKRGYLQTQPILPSVRRMTRGRTIHKPWRGKKRTPGLRPIILKHGDAPLPRRGPRRHPFDRLQGLRAQVDFGNHPVIHCDPPERPRPNPQTFFDDRMEIEIEEPTPPLSQPIPRALPHETRFSGWSPIEIEKIDIQRKESMRSPEPPDPLAIEVSWILGESIWKSVEEFKAFLLGFGNLPVQRSESVQPSPNPFSTSLPLIYDGFDPQTPSEDLRGNTETFKSCQTISLRETNEASTSSGKSVEQNGEVDVTSKAIQENSFPSNSSLSFALQNEISKIFESYDLEIERQSVVSLYQLPGSNLEHIGFSIQR